MADKSKRSAPASVSVMEPSSSSSSSSGSASMSKRRRTACLDHACQFQQSSPDIEVEESCHSFKISSEKRAGSPVNSSEVSSVSCCSCHEEASQAVNESSSVLDLEAKGFNTPDTTFTKLKSFSTFSEVSGDSDGLELREKSSPALASCRKILPTVRMPPQDEIEEFFSVAEKYEQKRFAEKYNYDVVKDAPLEGGRYQWVRLK